MLLAVPASAGAADRFVVVGGSGSVLNTTCPADNPCSLDHALAIPLLPGDEVIAGPGDYDLGSGGVTVPAGVMLRAADGQPPPRIAGSPPTGATVTAAGPAATLSRLRVSNATPGGPAVSLATGAVMRASSAWGQGANGIGVEATGTPGPTLHNVTAVGSPNEGVGIASAAVGPALTGTDVIAEGATDLDATGGAPTFTLTNSNFDSAPSGVTVLGAGNQPAEPSLADPANGDFHEATGSPTIDTGVADPLAGLVDLDGDSRLLGLAPDIGADEYISHLPSASTGGALDIVSTGATLTGSVNPNGLPTSYHFDYGSGLAYGQSTPTEDAGAGTASTPVTAPLTGLTPGSIVHYRLVATNADGSAAGLDRLLIVPPDATLPGGGGGGGGGILPQGAGPQILGLNIPINPVVGEPTTLTVRADDPERPVNGITVSFDEGPALFAESACRMRPRSRLFDGVGSTRFAVPYTFREPGVHQVTVTLSSGRCGRSKRTTTQVVTVDAAPAPAQRVPTRALDLHAAGCTGADATPTATNLALIRSATRCLLNAERSAKGLRRLRTNRKLTTAARLHNKYMAGGGFFAHQGPGEPSLAQRFRKVRYSGGGGENLGLGVGVPYETPAGMVEGWMGSPLHRANILERRYRTIGIAVLASKPTPPPPKPGATYTTEFGTK
jgi:uncharacterized protein YkwD